MENTEKPKGMYFNDVLNYLGISRTTFYTHYFKNLTVEKDASGYRNIFLRKEIEDLKDKISKYEMVK